MPAQLAAIILNMMAANCAGTKALLGLNASANIMIVYYYCYSVHHYTQATHHVVDC